MLNQIFPQRFDNAYRGHWLALWLFGLVVVFKGAISIGVIVNGRNAAISADGIPLDSFTVDGAEAFLSLFAAWGLGHLMLNVIGAIVLIRYRTMVPLMYLLLLVEHLTRKLIFWYLPMPRAEAPGLYINLVLVGLMVVGLTLSLWNRAEHDWDTHYSQK